jgi:ankyrin repeat protein
MSKKSIYRFTKVGIIIAVQIVFFASSLIAFAASMDEELIQAASKNDLNAVNDLISKGADVNTTNVFLATPLIVAAKCGNTECVKALLKAGANANAKCIQTCTALLWSADLGHIDVVKALVDNGADLEVADFYGWTPLMKATYQNNFEIVKLLIEKGANVNATNSAGNSILYIAEELSLQPDIIDLLVNAGATKSFGN